MWLWPSDVICGKYFLNINKYNVILVLGGYGERWALSFPQEKRVSKRDPGGGINYGYYFNMFP
jgi:hypothetical protein